MVDHCGWKLFECCIYSRHGNPGAWWSKRFRVDHEFILIFFKGQRPSFFDKSHMMIESKHAGRSFAGTDRTSGGDLRPIAKKVVNPTKCRGTIWGYASSNTEGNKLKMKHPATFPDKLASDVVKCFTSPEGLVVDPMCGSGTTLVAAGQAGRRFVGFDVSEAYIEIANQRIAAEVPE